MRRDGVGRAGAAVLGCVVLIGGAGAQTREAPGLKTGTTEGGKVAKSVSDPDFINQAIMSDHGTIDLANLALGKTKNPKVKQAAQSMVTDHTQMMNELKQVAQTVGYKYDDGTSPESKTMATELSGKSGPAFDSAFVTGLIRMHQADVALFQSEAASAKVEPVMRIAGRQLPRIEEHLHGLEALLRTGL